MQTLFSVLQHFKIEGRKKMSLIDKYKDEQRRAAQEEKEQAAKKAEEDARYRALKEKEKRQAEREIDEILRQTNLVKQVSDLARQLGLKVVVSGLAQYGPYDLYHGDYYKGITVQGEVLKERDILRYGEKDHVIDLGRDKPKRRDLEIRVTCNAIQIDTEDRIPISRHREYGPAESTHLKKSGFAGWEKAVIEKLGNITLTEKTKKKLEKLLGD